MNHLKDQKSPYLKQHAHNPVDWYPWGPQAFERAVQQNKPIFLSIGYSTCHWCHVMEKESFEDDNIAQILNRSFISIKVDREERPDIDQVYMTVCQMMNGQGGWPLNLFLTPQKEAFFSGTYFPKTNKYGRLGFDELLKRVEELWANKKSDVLKTAQAITTALKEISDQAQTTKSTVKETLDKSEKSFMQEFDSQFGGFGSAPKFPNGHKFLFLMALYDLTKNPKLLELVEYSLMCIHQGGIYDHIGGGIHRYSTDEQWVQPHFEKMLYDQALMAMCYVQAFQITKKVIYKKIAEDIFEFVNRELLTKEGVYFSAFDADSEGVEGRFYTWTTEELKSILENDEWNWFNKNFHVMQEGNFKDEASHQTTGQNIIFLKENFLKCSNEEVEEYYSKWAGLQKKLYKFRIKRIPPLKDNKILCDWNGLIIVAMLMGARAFQDAKLKGQAIKALDFFISSDLKHSQCEGVLNNEVFLDDYSNIIWACIEAYETTTQEKYLIKIKDYLKELESFENESPGYFFSSKKSDTVIIRKKEVYDGATPSGNSVMLYNLTKLSRIFKNNELLNKSESLIQKYLGVIDHNPTAFSFWLLSLLWQCFSDTQCILVFKESDSNYKEFKKNLDLYFNPLAVKIFKNIESVTSLKYLGDYGHDKLATLYKCQAFICRKPTTNALDI